MISVIIPVYNVKDYLGKCLQSLKTQTYRQWEAIAVDDGSTDGSGELLRNITYNDPRFKVIHQENQGLAAARNRGLEEAQGDSIFFLDSDDWLDPLCLDHLQACSEFYPEVGRIIGLDYTHHEKFGWNSVWEISHPGVHDPDSPFLFTPGCDVGHATACLYVRKNIPCEIRFPDVKIFEDMIFNMGLIFAGVKTLITMTEVYHYIIRDGSLIHSYLTDRQAEQIRGALASLIERYNPPKDQAERFTAFLENAIEGRIEKNK